MQMFESVAARILEPISQLLQKPLSLVDGQSPEARNAFAIRLSTPRVAIVSTDGKPFTDIERRLIDEVFGLMRTMGESEARYEELEHRMLSLQRENLDLVVKNRTLSEVSSRDSLTGLYNRWFVIEKIDSEMNRALRHGSPMSLIMLDIDHFKRVNDTWGHGAGDQVSLTRLRRAGPLRRRRVLHRSAGDEAGEHRRGRRTNPQPPRSDRAPVRRRVDLGHGLDRDRRHGSPGDERASQSRRAHRSRRSGPLFREEPRTQPGRIVGPCTIRRRRRGDRSLIGEPGHGRGRADAID